MKLWISLICLVLLSSYVHAEYMWTQFGNPDHAYFTGFSSGTASVNNVTWNKCGLTSSTYSPVSMDLDNDNLNEYITTSTTEVSIYDGQCQSKHTIAFGVSAAPVILPPETISENPKLMLLNTTHLVIYQYDNSGVIDVIKILSLATAYNATGMTGLACNYYAGYEKCLLTKPGNRSTFIYDVSNDDYWKLSDIYAASRTPTIASYIGWTGAYINSPGGVPAFVYPVLSDTAQAAPYIHHLYVYLVTDLGTSTRQWYYPYTDSVTNTISDFNGYIATLGSQKMLFIKIYSFSSSPANYNSMLFVADLYGNTRWNVTTMASGSAGDRFSNIVVADYNKDGENEFCYMDKLPDTRMICRDDTFNVVYNQSTSTTAFNHFVMADFNHTKGYLGYATSEGIFTINSEMEYNSTYIGTRTGYPIVFNEVGNPRPKVLYSDSSLAFLIGDFNMSGYCGNSYCEDWENEFSCPADCSSIINTTSNHAMGMPCERSTDCYSRKCEAGYCVAKMGKEDCTLDGQCASGACYNGKCTEPDIWTKIDTGKGELYGDSTLGNLFICVFVIVMTAAGIIGMGAASLGSFAIALIAVVTETIFFVWVGWMSPIFIVGLILVGLIIFAISQMLRG